MDRGELIAKRLTALKEELEGQATLVAVSKYSSVVDIQHALKTGHLDFGESRVQDLRQKAATINHPPPRWHFIGHLQRNKVKQLLLTPNLYAIHSVDSCRLLGELIACEVPLLSSPLSLYFQVNCSGEESKGGVTPGSELDQLVETILSSSNGKLSLAGLMTMGRIATNNFGLETRQTFSALRQERDRIAKKFTLSGLGLSMGMSGDYRIALQEESDIVRIGGHIFSPN
jgi:PLP dependent protein